MIWECTVCTNHFDGEAPADHCDSCGSPREYFTAYHYYGLHAPTISYQTTRSKADRPSYAESVIEAITCYRFHSTKYFFRDPSEFYRNFLETRRTFMEKYRFAGRGWNSGFYFATTKASAIAEKVFYEELTSITSPSEPEEVLKELRKRGSNCIFLEVTLSLDKVADLTDPIVLEYFLREGPARASFQPSGVPYAIARTIMPSSKAGSRHTDGIGYHAWSNGWNAVKFPSVRALSAAWGIDNLTRLDILRKLPEDHPRTTEDSVETQLRNHAIIVVFSGSLLTRSISGYAWVDEDGIRTVADNRYFGVQAKSLEAVRIAYREHNCLSPAEAAMQGYLSDDEIAEGFAPDSVMWVPKNEVL